RRAKVRAVINTASSITGRYPNMGPSLLLAADVPLLDGPAALPAVVCDGDEVVIDEEGRIFRDGSVVGTGVWLTEKIVAHKLEAARANLPAEVERFIDNTLTHA